MPQLLKSFKPQLIKTSDISTVLFIQTFLTNPQTAIQDTVDQVKPENLIVNTAGGYYTEGHRAKEEKNHGYSFSPNQENMYWFSPVDFINNSLRHQRPNENPKKLEFS